MTDNSKKLSELTQASNASSTDRVLILRDPAGSPSTRTITVGNLAKAVGSAGSNTFTIGNFSINAASDELNFNVSAANAENSNSGFKWYAGNTELAKLERDGHLVVNRVRSHYYNDFHLASDGLIANPWIFANNGVLHLPTTVGDIHLNNVSVIFSSSNMAISNSAPSNSTSNGTVGNLRYDSSYLYICVANNSWKRISLESF